MEYTYSESSTIFPNPERGLKYFLSSKGMNNNYISLNENINDEAIKENHITIIWRIFYLGEFMAKDISKKFLDKIQKDFSILRENRKKCIIRFAYTYPNGNPPRIGKIPLYKDQQPSKAQILRHINTLSPYLKNNKDVILAHQAGFIGSWGEWHYIKSDEFGEGEEFSSQQISNRKEILDAILEATPIEIPIQVRYPHLIKQKLYSKIDLEEESAYENTPFARIGFYNDAFLNNNGDMGTYRVPEDGGNKPIIEWDDYKYVSKETNFVPMTGETNGQNGQRTKAENALKEMELTNWTSINYFHFTSHIDDFKEKPEYYDSILRRLGYRFVLQTSSCYVSDGFLSIKFSLTNVGFARLFKQRNVYLIFENTDNPNTQNIEIELRGIDPRKWKGNVVIEPPKIDVSSYGTGTYECYLNLPDPANKLRTFPEYSIRFANEDIWDKERGFNKLFLQFTVN